MKKMLKPGYIPLTEELCKRMAVFRKVNSLSVAKLADKIGIPRHRYANAELLNIGSIHKSVLENIANISDAEYPCSIDYFYKFDNSFIENLPFNLFAKAVRVYLGLTVTQMGEKLGIGGFAYEYRELRWGKVNGIVHEFQFSEDERDKIMAIWKEIVEALEGCEDYELSMLKYGDLSDMSQFMRDIQKLRIDLNLSIVDFMKSIGRSPALYRKWIDQDNPTQEDIKRINELYGTNFTI